MPEQSREHAPPEALVRSLIEAENSCDREAAARLPSAGSIAITRAKGREQNRESLLDEIATPADPTLRRRLEAVEVVPPRAIGRCAVRSLVATDGPQPGRFRNLHLLEDEAGSWRCVLWQVTELRT
ncbi:DUF4440 domain-containing protein [Nonomuraea sp. NPDC050547]|uniref:DUF4440 domain-containing protein n=1 Tax=Nonomuraea sp. NPDC050547 TaxID=3364368 RepID=UPI0037BA06D7